MALSLNEKIFIAFIWIMLLGFLVCMGIIDHSFSDLFDDIDKPLSSNNPDSIIDCASCIASRNGCTIDICTIKNVKTATKVALWTSVIAFIIFTGMLVWYYMATKGTTNPPSVSSPGAPAGQNVADLQKKLADAQAALSAANAEKNKLTVDLSASRAETKIYETQLKHGGVGKQSEEKTPLEVVRTPENIKQSVPPQFSKLFGEKKKLLM